MIRSSVVRKMNGVEYAAEEYMSYPYDYINDEFQENYSLENILRPIIVEPDPPDIGNFPQNIREHFWVRGGENDGDSWMSCGELKNGVYFFFSGSCDYTGFDCQGGMKLVASTSWQNIVDHAMTQEEYDLYVKQTTDPPMIAASQEL